MHPSSEKAISMLPNYMLMCSLYAVAVQSKTHEGAFAIIFFICRDLTAYETLVLIILSLSNI